MTISGFQQRELFHLHFLRFFSQRMTTRAYAVKGGICLRFFHQSPRLSEDMDIDVSPRIQVNTLQKSVDTILQSQAFLASLTPHGIVQVNFSKPKQTITTQRWKMSLGLSPEISLSTKIEFSRRKEKINFLSGIPNSVLLIQCKIIPFASQYYDLNEMIKQKINALVSPNRQASRDLFDLHHLFQLARHAPASAALVMDAETIEKASEKISVFTYHNFREQVIPFLPGNLITHYNQIQTFESLKQEVENQIIGLLP